MGAALFGFGVTVAVERGCHTLSLVALKSELAGKLLQRDPVAARREIDEVGRVAREALTQVRAAVTGIRAAVIAAELASAKLLLESDGVAFKYARVDTALPPGVENALAMTVREAVTISSATPARSMPKWPSRPIAAMSCCISSTTAAVARSCRAMAWAACANASRRSAVACASIPARAAARASRRGCRWRRTTMDRTRHATMCQRSDATTAPLVDVCYFWPPIAMEYAPR